MRCRGVLSHPARCHEDVARIAAECLVPAVAVEYDGDVHDGSVGRRSNEGMADESANGSSKCQVSSAAPPSADGIDHKLVVVGAVPLGHRPGVRPLVEPRVLEADARTSSRVRALSRAMAATTADESIPPDRNAPRGVR